MMMDALWRAILLSANLWGAGGLDGLGEAQTEYRVEVRTESGPPILSQIPYVSRLFRNVGWSQAVMPVLPPIKAGTRCASQPPSGDEILRCLPELTRIEGVYEESRDDIRMVFEKLVDQVDPPRFFPVIGPAQLHRVNWKCTVSFLETIKICYPVIEVKRQRSEVVYIDKDHLHLHLSASEKEDAEAQEIRPLPPAAKPAKCAAVPQVQLDIVVATINRSARPKLTYPWVNEENAAIPFGVGADPKVPLAFLYKLRDEGVLKIMAEPSITTLAGKEATFFSGAEVPVTTTDGRGSSSTSYQEVGTRITVLPTLTKHGTIRLEVQPEISRLNQANSISILGVTPTFVPGFDLHSCQVTTSMKPGETLAIAMATQQERETEKRITLLGNNPFIGAIWMTIKKREGINEDTVILVTPRIVTPCPCEAEEQEQPDTRVVACWENRAASMVGSVYLFSEETKRPIEAAGRLEVQAFDMAPALRGEEPRLLAQWTFDGEALKKLQRKDQIGVGYTLSAPWADLPANVENIKLTTVYVPGQGASCSDEPTYVARRNFENDALQAQQSDERPSKVVQALAVSNKSGTRQMSLDDIIRLAKNGVSDRVIIGQIAPTESKFYLTVEDVVRLSKNGVSDLVIWVLVDNSEFDLTVDDLISLTQRGVSDKLIGYMQDRPKKR